MEKDIKFRRKYILRVGVGTVCFLFFLGRNLSLGFCEGEYDLPLDEAHLKVLAIEWAKCARYENEEYQQLRDRMEALDHTHSFKKVEAYFYRHFDEFKRLERVQPNKEKARKLADDLHIPLDHFSSMQPTGKEGTKQWSQYDSKPRRDFLKFPLGRIDNDMLTEAWRSFIPIAEYMEIGIAYCGADDLVEGTFNITRYGNPYVYQVEWIAPSWYYYRLAFSFGDVDFQQDWISLNTCDVCLISEKEHKKYITAFSLSAIKQNYEGKKPELVKIAADLSSRTNELSKEERVALKFDLNVLEINSKTGLDQAFADQNASAEMANNIKFYMADKGYYKSGYWYVSTNGLKAGRYRTSSTELVVDEGEKIDGELMIEKLEPCWYTFAYTQNNLEEEFEMREAIHQWHEKNSKSWRHRNLSASYYFWEGIDNYFFPRNEQK